MEHEAGIEPAWGGQQQYLTLSAYADSQSPDPCKHPGAPSSSVKKLDPGILGTPKNEKAMGYSLWIAENPWP
jgi:hypothetical protein